VNGGGGRSAPDPAHAHTSEPHGTPDPDHVHTNTELDLKHVGLIVSAGTAVALRFFSDFSFATIQHQAALDNLDQGQGVSAASLGALALTSLSYELQRDWFNLSPQAPPEIVILALVLVAAYALIRRALAPTTAVATVLLIAPFVPLLVTAVACAWVLIRAARVA
jgi:uncharacterized membrane protein